MPPSRITAQLSHTLTMQRKPFPSQQNQISWIWVNRFVSYFLLLLVGLIGATSTVYASETTPSPTAQLSASDQIKAAHQNRYSGQRAQVITQDALLLEDPSKKLTWQDVISTQSDWQKPANDLLSLGLSKSTWWLKYSLNNDSDFESIIILGLSSALMDYIDWHIIDEKSNLLQTTLTGDRRPFIERDSPTRAFHQRILLPAHTTRYILIRLDTYDGLFDTAFLIKYKPDSFIKSVIFDATTTGVFLGTMLALLIYTLLIWKASKEHVYGLMVVHLISFLAWYCGFYGITYQVFWPTQPEVNSIFFALSGIAASASFGIFALHYLKPPPNHPRTIWHKINTGLSVALILMSPIVLLGLYAISWTAIIALSASLLIGIQIQAIILGKRKLAYARNFAIAFILSMLSAVQQGIKTIGIKSDFISQWVPLEVGFSFGYFLLLYGVTTHIHALRKLRAEQNQLDRENALAEEAQLRQAQLQTNNRDLLRKSITDELTGTYNRRFFNETLARLLSPDRPSQHALGLCMIDVDYFKLYNDHYGHPAGDYILKRIAKAIMDDFGNNNQRLFRLGGEEFGILFSSANPQSAQHFVDHLCTVVRNLSEPHVQSPIGRITISVGAAWWPKEDLPQLRQEYMYRQADQALYRAKNQGRDRALLLIMSTTPIISSDDKDTPLFNSTFI